MSAPLLMLQDLQAWRSAVAVLHGIDLRLEAGESLALLGDNGAGKSSLLLAIAGHLRSAGAMALDGASIIGLPAHRRARLGIGFCPEGRRVFAGMTVEENLLVAGRDRTPQAIDEIWRLFPEIERRRASLAWQLSGGEQQMLAIGRAMMGRPRIMLLDEPFLGLAPESGERLATALRSIAANGISMLVADQDAKRAQTLCDRSIFIHRGRILP